MKKGGLWVHCDGIDSRGHHVAVVERMVAEGKIPLVVGVGHLDIYHDDWCGIFTESKLCDCDPEVTYRPPDDVKATVVLQLEPGDEFFESALLWVVESCPYCGGKHVHGAGSVGDDPRKLLNHRVSHCGPWGYDLVEEVGG